MTPDKTAVLTDPAAERAQIAGLLAPSLAAAFEATADRLDDEPAFSDKVGIDGAGWRTLSWAATRAQGLELAAVLVDPPPPELLVAAPPLVDALPELLSSPLLPHAASATAHATAAHTAPSLNPKRACTDPSSGSR